MSMEELNIKSDNFKKKVLRSDSKQLQMDKYLTPIKKT